jgi:hypothetical protein
MLAESLPERPAVLSLGLHSRKNALLPPALLPIHNFGIMLQPRWIVGAGRLDQ